jgi:8-oxo-dGTP pyrophosphatase MutT (NUDIX family)
MVAGSILPVAFHKNKLFFLFGKENELADTPGWSDFGGGVNNKETPYHTALREGSEELTGFLGDETILKKYNIIHKIMWNTYNLHIIVIPYDENLPRYFNNNHTFLWKRLTKQFLNKTKLFEKQEIKWFSVDDMKDQRSTFREFYRNILDIVIKDIPIFYNKVKQLNYKMNSTKKNNKLTRGKKMKYSKRFVRTRGGKL